MTDISSKQPTYDLQVQEFIDYMGDWIDDSLVHYILGRYQTEEEFLHSAYEVCESDLNNSHLRELKGFSTNGLLVGLVIDNEISIVKLFNENREQAAFSILSSGMTLVDSEDELASIINSADLLTHKDVMVALGLFVVRQYSAQYCHWRRRLMDRAGEQAAIHVHMDESDNEISETPSSEW